MRARVVVGVAALALAGTAATRAAVSAPVVALSTCTLRPATRARDTVCVVAAWTKPAGAVAYRVAARSTWTGAATGYRTTGQRDTLRVPRVVCYVRDTVVVAVQAETATGVTDARTARLALPCRAPSIAEAAMVDTFGLRLLVRDTAGSATLTLDTNSTQRICVMRRNRFTGRVSVVDGGAACETARAAVQREAP